MLLRSSILKLDYLCDFGSSISKIWHWGGPLNSLLNATGLTWFGFLKTNLCPISYDDLIMDWFSREKLYHLPCVIFSSFGSKIDSQETTVRVLAWTFLRHSNQMLRERVMNIFPRSPLWDEIWEPENDLTSTDHISENIMNQDLKFCEKCSSGFQLRTLNILAS